jgi:hypothetical protein
MILNPKRILTEEGMRRILGALQHAPAPGPLGGFYAYAVLSATLSPDQRKLTAVTMGTDNLEVPQELTLSVPVHTSEAGKTYRASGVISFEVSSPTGPQTIVGIMVSNSDTYEDAVAYLELDQPVTLDADGEFLSIAIEFGFDGQTFYVMPRVLPIGM